jgi:plasmid stabilization system protein ParE
MDYHLTWSETASFDLESIRRFLSARSTKASEKIISAIMDSVQLLRTQPFLGQVYTGDHSVTTREIVCRKYRIFYSVDEKLETVAILTIWHGQIYRYEFSLKLAGQVTATRASHRGPGPASHSPSVLPLIVSGASPLAHILTLRRRARANGLRPLSVLRRNCLPMQWMQKSANSKTGLVCVYRRCL